MTLGTITSEKAGEHYKHLEPEGAVVLDLGCGRWGIKELDDTSPGYFHKRGAKLVVGVDRNAADIEYFRDRLPGTFIRQNLGDAYDVRTLLLTYSPSVLKVDIEGDEVLLLELVGDDLAGVEQMAVEYHGEEIESAVAKWAEGLHFVTRANCRFTYGSKGKGVLFFSR